MTNADLLLPVFVQVGLTFFLQLWMGRLRVGALQQGGVKVRDIALRQPAWPERATQVANCFHNQLELPVLFYVLIAFVLITNTANYALLILAWAFVISRIVHAYVHTTSNNVRRRFYVFLVGAAILVTMWIIFAVRILAA